MLQAFIIKNIYRCAVLSHTTFCILPLFDSTGEFLVMDLVLFRTNRESSFAFKNAKIKVLQLLSSFPNGSQAQIDLFWNMLLSVSQ